MNVTLDVKDVVEGAQKLKKRFPYKIRRALKKAGTSARAAMVKAMKEDTGLPASRIRKDIVIVTVGDHAIRLEIKGNRLPLIDFKARGPEPSRGRGKGVRYKLPGGRGSDPHAFIATMPSGHRGVFKRTGKTRTPIEQLHGPSLVKVFEKFLPIGEARGREALIANLRHEIDYAGGKS